jgi:hypothetical protein
MPPETRADFTLLLFLKDDLPMPDYHMVPEHLTNGSVPFYHRFHNSAIKVRNPTDRRDRFQPGCGKSLLFIISFPAHVLYYFWHDSMNKRIYNEWFLSTGYERDHQPDIIDR